MRFKKSKMVTVAAATITVLSLIVTGCGASTSQTSQSGNQPKGEPILVGVPIPQTGPYAADGKNMLDGLTLAMDDINAQGGVLGRPLKLNTFDTEDGTPEKINAAADKLNMQDKVAVNVTGYLTPGVDALAFGRYKTPFFASDEAQLDVDTIKEKNLSNFFIVGDTEPAYGKQMFDDLINVPYSYPNKKIVMLVGDYDWDKKVTASMKEEALAKGWEVPMYQIFPYGTREWGPTLAKIRDINPAILEFANMDPADVKTFLDQFALQPTKTIVDVGYAASINQFAQIVGENGNGVTGMTCVGPLPEAKGKDFAERYKAKFNEEPSLSVSGTVYDSLMIWAEAVKQVGKVDDFDAVNKAIKNIKYDGVCGSFTFDNDYKVPISGVPMHFFQVQNGNLVRLSVGTKKTADFITPSWAK